MNVQRFPTWLAAVPVVAGIALHTYTSLFKSNTGPSAFTVGLLIWSAVPYLICLLIAMLGKQRRLSGFVGAAAALIYDVNLYHAVFISPIASTAALGLLWAPVFNLLVCIPLGLLTGYCMARWFGRDGQV